MEKFTDKELIIELMQRMGVVLDQHSSFSGSKHLEAFCIERPTFENHPDRKLQINTHHEGFIAIEFNTEENLEKFEFGSGY